MKIDFAKSDEDLKACLLLRREVFIEEQNVPEALEVDGEDAEFLHVLVKQDGKAMGTARFRYKDQSVKVQRVCVPAHARGMGLGALVMNFIIEAVKFEGKAHTINLSSQDTAIEFYEKLGFLPQGETYMDAGIPHMDMVLKL